MLGVLVVAAAPVFVANREKVEAFVTRTAPKIFDMKYDVRVTDVRIDGQSISAAALVDGYAVNMQLNQPEDRDLEVIWADSKEDVEWVYSEPNQTEKDQAIELLADDIGSFYKLNLVRVISFRTKRMAGRTVKQMTMVIEFAGQENVHKLEYYTDDDNRPKFAAAKILE